jgi:YHS domain-containing protein
MLAKDTEHLSHELRVVKTSRAQLVTIDKSETIHISAPDKTWQSPDLRLTNQRRGQLPVGCGKILMRDAASLPPCPIMRAQPGRVMAGRYRSACMRPMFACLIALSVCFSTSAFAGDEHSHSHDEHSHAKSKPPTRTSDVYARSVDALTGEPLGDQPVTIRHQGRELKFANQANADAFNKDPVAAIKKLDEAIAAEQKGDYALKTCVIAGEALGSMGDPVDVVVGNRLFRLCCAGCKRKLVKDPKPAFQKLDAAVIEAQKPTYPLKTCLVMDDDAIGADAVDYVVANRLVRFCCDGCVTEFEKNPQKYLTKLDAAKK